MRSRRQAFAVVIERAKIRNEVRVDLDANFVFDVMTGMMLYGLIFPTTSESWQEYVRRAVEVVIG